MSAPCAQRLRSLTATSTTRTSTTITCFCMCVVRINVSASPSSSQTPALGPPRERRHTPSDPTCAEPVRSVVRAGFEKRDGAAVAPADVVICSCWEADGFCAGRLARGAMRCGAVRAVQDEKLWAAGTCMGTLYMCINVFFTIRMRAAGELLMLVLRGLRS